MPFIPHSQCLAQTGCQRLQLHELPRLHDATEQEVHQGRSVSVLLDAKYGEVGLDACCSSIGRRESSGKLAKQWKDLVKTTAPPFIERHHIGLGINDALEHGLPTDAPEELLMFALEGVDVLRCELALETGSHPDNEGDEIILQHLAEGEWKTGERRVVNTNVGIVPLGSNLRDTGRQLNEQIPERINEGCGRL